MTDLVSPLPGQELRFAPTLDDYEETGSEHDPYQRAPLHAANLITSEVAGKEGRRHKVVIDLDFPAKLVPSSTPGHAHLYIDKEIGWDSYLALLRALVAAGLVEPGYLGASEARGFTAVRLPWVRKKQAPEVFGL